MKYETFTTYLNSSEQGKIRLSFSQVETILGFKIGRSPRNYRAWWANGCHSHANAWTDAGYKVEAVNLVNEWTVFRKDGAGRTQDKKTTQQNRPKEHLVRPQSTTISSSDSIEACGYLFRFLQEIRPVMESDRVKEFVPELMGR